MEQMLEALAKARRAQFGDDPKMPNPMRARLHDEIAQAAVAEDETVESRPSWITMFWPRVTVAAALATLIVLVPAILWNRSHPLAGSGEVALRDRAAGPADELNSAVAAGNTLATRPVAGATESTVDLADNGQIKIETAAPSSEAGALASSTRVLQGGSASESPSEVTTDKEIAAAKLQAAPAAAFVAGSDSKVDSDRMTAAAPPVALPPSAGSSVTRQQFSQQSAVQSFRNNAQASRAANVLNTFQVEQRGSEIRVLDADGSTYRGRIEQLAKSVEPESRTTERRAMAKQAPRHDAQAASDSEMASPQSYFRATGFNVSLKKTLVFEGNYAAPPGQQPAPATSNERERTKSSRDRARIVGTVRVNGEAPVQVDAMAETPEPAATKKNEK